MNRDDFITFQELQERWPSADEARIFELIKKGEPKFIYTYKDPNVKTEPQYFFEAYHPITLEAIRTGPPWVPLDPHGGVPYSLNDLREIVPFLNQCLFEIGHVSEVEELFPELLIDESKAGEEKTTLVELNTPRTENYFHHKGDFWNIGFEGHTATVRHVLGIQYVAHLLQTDEPISCLELYQSTSGAPTNCFSEGEAIDQGLHYGTSKQEVSDERARKDYLSQYYALQNDLSAAKNILERAEIEEKMDQLLKAATQRKASFAPEWKNAQSNVKKRIDRAIKIIESTDLSKLAEHLKTHIKPDGKYGLSYSGGIAWNIII
jgi:hypothetical protein